MVAFLLYTHMITGMHIEPTNICTLKCPGCSRTQFISDWPNRWQNHSLDVDDLLVFLDIDLKGVLLNLCGNYGDPIYHPNFEYFVQRLKANGARLQIITNGSHRSAQWWTNLVRHLDIHDHVMFSIDGLPGNFQQYRINGDWPTISDAISICVDSPVTTTWKYIPFSFNEHCIEQARILSESMGIDKFAISKSNRFDRPDTVIFRPSQDLTHGQTQNRIEFKQNREQQIQPKCQQGGEHFISAQGYYMPCCFVGEHRFYYKTVFGRDQSSYDIRNHTLTEILQQNQTKNFYQNILSDKPKVCQFSCSATG